MMKTKDYAKCSSSTELILSALQNGMIIFMQQENIMKSLESGHYLYHQAFSKATSDVATPRMILHAFLEIMRYCLEHSDCCGGFLNILCEELCTAICGQGERIHLQELRLHGGKIHIPLTTRSAAFADAFTKRSD